MSGNHCIKMKSNECLSMLLFIFIHHCPLQRRLFFNEDGSIIISRGVFSFFVIAALFTISCYVGPWCNNPALYRHLLGPTQSILDCNPSSRQFLFPSVPPALWYIRWSHLISNSSNVLDQATLCSNYCFSRKPLSVVHFVILINYQYG